MAEFTPAALTGFRDAAQSLKLYRRAELSTEGGSSLIEDLYVDPLPEDHILQTILKPNTTFIIGRKGTGKSTVFQRAQHELRASDSIVSAYVDIKTVYESSQVDPSLLADISALPSTLPAASLERLLLYRAFLQEVIGAIRQELETKVRRTIWQKIKATIGQPFGELFEGLDELLDAANSDRFISVLATRTENIRETGQSSDGTALGIGAAASVSPTAPGLNPSLSYSASASSSSGTERTFADVLLRVFDVKEYVIRLRDLLHQVGIRQLYVFIDDFSELPPEAMELVVDTVLAPLNNWSDELVKFKVAAYPGRVYLGSIDKTKIDEVNLDLFSLYGTSNITTMEEKAIEFTRRLIQKRLGAYAHLGTDEFFAPRNDDEIWRHLFYATMANPRNLGYLLFFLYESKLIYGQQINVTAIREAARRYYEEKIEAYFAMNRFLHESFSERSSIYSLRDLLDEIIERARGLRSHQGSEIMKDISGRPPTSHFHVVTELESLLSTLELNFFLTKYYVQSDRDGRQVTVFALNYGLCNKFTIEFGRPTGRREYRLYFVERIFDYTSLLQGYVRTNQEIVCDSCAARYELANLSALQLYGMMCPSCKSGTCTVTNLSKKYEQMLRAISDELLLPRVELGILHTLGTAGPPQFPADIAGELDCSYQLVGKRGKILADRGLVLRSKNDAGRRQLTITEQAKQIYLDSVLDGPVASASDHGVADNRPEEAPGAVS
ncbi:MAG: hypothetical protein M0027_12425 [Candidatus Dormibacteraeota bacterium]|jgi:DNA-binding MarR family transcriptional regulator|nr:hypothetical protein [Candidatus Dormibacteraeota bacterium]